MGIRVTVPSVKGSNSIFHKLSYYGPHVYMQFIEDKLYIMERQEEGATVLAVIKDWIYIEYIEKCEDNRRQYKPEEGRINEIV